MPMVTIGSNSFFEVPFPVAIGDRYVYVGRGADSSDPVVKVFRWDDAASTAVEESSAADSPLTWDYDDSHGTIRLRVASSAASAITGYVSGGPLDALTVVITVDALEVFKAGASVAKFIGNYVRGVPVGVHIDPVTASVKLGAQLPVGFEVTILHQHESLNLASLVDPRIGPTTLSKHSFEECQLVGPTILVPIGSVEIAGCDFDLQGASLESLVWVLPAGMPVTGAVVVTDVSLRRCSLVQVAFAVPADQRQGLLAMLRGR